MKGLAMKAKNRLLCIIILIILVASCLPTRPSKSPELVAITSEAVTTITAKATGFPTATPTRALTPTSTPLPSIIPGHWAEKEDGTLDAKKMYPLVGAINYTHHKSVDWLYQNDLKVAVITTDDVSQMDAAAYDDYKNLKKDDLNNNANLQAQLDLVRSQLDPNNLDKYTVVVENGVTKWVVDRTDEILISYRQLDADGKLTVEVEPQLLPELRVNRPYIERADTSEKIQFAGGWLFTLERPTPEIPTILDYVKYYVELNRSVGINMNIIRLGFDTREVLPELGVKGITKYVFERHAGAQPVTISNVDDFEATARYLEEQGIYVIIHPSFVSGEFLIFPTEEVAEALNLLSSKLSYRRNVLFSLWNEVGGEHTWTEWTPWITKLSDPIYQNYHDQYKPIIVVGGTWWARDFRGADIPINNYAIDVHEYKVWDYEGGPRYKVDWWTHMVGKVPVLITENGELSLKDDNPLNEDFEYIRETLEYTSDHLFEVHYLGIRIDAWGGGSVFYPWFTDRITPRGEEWRNSEALKRMTDFTR